MMQRYGLSPRSGGAGAMGADRDRVERGACVRNLQQLGLALRVYSSEHEGVFPSEVGAISDELGATRFLVCPADTEKNPAPSWQDFDPTVHMTYEFPGASGREDEPQAVIFRCPIHDNVALGDGSVQVGTGGTQTGVTPPMDEIMRRRYGLGSGTGDSMMRSDVRQEGESEMRQLYEEISALDSELGSVQQEQRKAQSEYAKLVMREVDAARTRQATSQERLEALSFPADRLPGIVNQDERYQKLKAGYETAVLDGDEAAQKRARARLEEWVDKIYRPELEAEVELADRQTAAVQACAQELSEQLQAFRAKEADTEKQLEAARLRLHQMEKRVETSSQR
jgi:hypothetical protein